MYVCISVSHLLYEQRTYEKENNHAFQFVSVATVAQKLHDSPALAPMSQSQSSSDEIQSSSDESSADYTDHSASSWGEPPGIVISSDSESTRARSVHGDTVSYDSSNDDTEPWNGGQPSEVSAEVQEQLDLAKEDRRKRRREARASEQIKLKPKFINTITGSGGLCVRPYVSRGTKRFRWAYPCHFARPRSASHRGSTSKEEWDRLDIYDADPIRFRHAVRYEGYYGDRYTLRKFIYRTCFRCRHWNRRREDETCPLVSGRDCLYDDAGPLECIMRMINADRGEMLNLSIIQDDDTLTVLSKKGNKIQRLRVQGTHVNGVRLCPWDEKALFIPVLCMKTQEIIGYGKRKKQLGHRYSYDMEGESEWFRLDDLQRDGLYHVIMYVAQFKLPYHSIDTDGHKWFKLTECMMAFFLFTHIANPKVCPRELTSFLERMEWDDIIDACPIFQIERACSHFLKQARLICPSAPAV